MADTPPTRLHIDPPMDQWQVTPRNGRTNPVIATGHQPYFWHPGILAKYIAAKVLAEKLGGTTSYVVVDHNPLPPLSIDIPLHQGDKLSVRSVRLDSRAQAGSVPPNRLPPLGRGQAIGLLHEAATRNIPGFIRDGLQAIAQGYEHDQVEHGDLSEQTQAVSVLIEPMLGGIGGGTNSIVTALFLDRLLADPINAVRCYNRAAAAYPEADIRQLYLGRDVVEVPLWAQDKATVTPVYADLGDSKRTQLFTTAHNSHLDLVGSEKLGYLRPRAITLSAIMRSERCDLFIHGTGGGIYDQVTELWWKDWVGEELAPKAVVSADVYLPFEVPVATQEQRIHAQWFAHHLPHNVDRFTDAQHEVEAGLRQEKRDLLDRMNEDRDKRRRSKAFQRVHAINAEIAQLHADVLHNVAGRAGETKLGVDNAAIARRRDWCFTLYPTEHIDELKRLIETALIR